MWIKLHDYKYDREIVVQTQNICTISPLVDANGCFIGFIGDNDNYIQVRETMDEIGAMITE